MNGNIGEIFSKVVVDATSGVATLQSVSQESQKTTQSLSRVEKGSDNVGKSFEKNTLTTREMRQGFSALIAIGAAFSTIMVASIVSFSSSMQDGKSAINEFKDAIGITKSALGESLAPVLRELVDAVTPFILAFASFVKNNPEVVQQFVKTGIAIGGLMVVIGTVGRLMLEFAHIGELVAGVIGMIGASSAIALLPVIAIGAAIAFLIGRNIYEQLKKTIEGFTDFKLGGVSAMKEVNKAAQDAADRINQVKDAIKAENDSFNQQLNEIINRRKQQLEENKKQLEKEEYDFKKHQEDLLKNYKQNTDNQKLENQSRIKDLEKTMQMTLIIGSETYEEDKKNFMQLIDDEIEAGNKKLEELTTIYENDTKAAKDEYDEKTNVLKAKIAEDEKLFQTHFDQIKNMLQVEVDDEITILNKNHAKKLADLQSQLAKTNAAYANSFDNIEGEYAKLGDFFEKNPLEIDLGGALNQAGVDIGNFLIKIGTGLSSGFLKIIGEIAKAISTVIRSALGNTIADKLGISTSKQIDETVNALTSGISKWMETGQLPGFTLPKMDLTRGGGGNKTGWAKYFANGVDNFEGGLAMVGERGPEMVRLPGGSDVIPNEKLGPSIVNNNVFNYTEDLNVFNARLNYMLKRY